MTAEGGQAGATRGAGDGGGLPPLRIRRSSGARRPPSPLPDGRRLGEAIPPMWEALGRTLQPWKVQLGTRWPDLVGAMFAPHARPGLMEGPDGKTLIVFVDHPIRQFEMERQLRNLKDRIRAAIPGAPVERVAYRQDPGRSD